MNKTFFRRLHLWLSVPLGLIVILMCLSGAILLFERDFGHIGQAEVKNEGLQPLPMDSILISASGYLNGKNEIVGVTTYPDADHAYKVLLAKPAMAAIWVNQYTGEVIGNYERAEIFKLASSVHRRLFGKSKSEGAYGAKTGKLIIGINTIGLFLIILTGFIIWWPKKGIWHDKLKISTKRGSYKFWFDIHCVGGVISSFVLVICIFTGLTWSFVWYRTALYSTFGSEVAKSSSHKTPAENFSAWETAYQTIATENADKEIRMYQGEADVVIAGVGNQQALDTHVYDPTTGKIIHTEKYPDKIRSNHIKGWIYTLHVGSWCGWISRILYLICVIIGAILPITGYYLWIKRLCKKKG
jgi:uncharacterized iron-regulated membrane protein